MFLCEGLFALVLLGAAFGWEAVFCCDAGLKLLVMFFFGSSHGVGVFVGEHVLLLVGIWGVVGDMAMVVAGGGSGAETDIGLRGSWR